MDNAGFQLREIRNNKCKMGDSPYINLSEEEGEKMINGMADIDKEFFPRKEAQNRLHNCTSMY